ncbi:MarR family winged helix-turn-helix transcriptional regulator [Granulicella sp. S156]|uniref:MarR family winged helix-turn-helix transcriptional regulator n=1 Tax=Granulicella sp. S156 TaxID=1747224 RepID=UPI00131B95A4|nr:MarR family transcriptional regulator [Granulicella sp. S156]
MISHAPQRIGFLVNRAARLLSRRAEKRLSKLGLAVAQVPVLFALREGTAVCQRDLAAIGQIEQPAMAELLSRMERDGYIERSPDPNDGRSSLIALTDSAKRKLAPARAALAIGHQETLAGFADEEIAMFAAFLQRAVSNLESPDI